MSEFACSVVRVTIVPHPNADAIEIAKVGDYQSIVRKGQFSDGDLAVYIPEQAIVPVWLLQKMEMWDEARQKGGLSGAAGNRVKAIKLRGIVSQGLLLSGDNFNGMLAVHRLGTKTVADAVDIEAFQHGADAAEFLGITKYEPAIPSHMAGRIVGNDLNATHKYDFDNLKKTPDLFEDGEEVIITEKIHGTLLCVGVVPTKDSKEGYYKGRVIVTSKGMGAKGFVLDHADETNLYAQTAQKYDLLDKLLHIGGKYADETGEPVFLFGEVFGRTASGAGIQDLTYTDWQLDFRAFDICLGSREQGEYLPWDDFEQSMLYINVETVPVLYRGHYSKAVVLALTDGNTTLTSAKHIREGVVVKSATEARHPLYGRKCAKSVSDAYLLRKNATELS